jgi:ribulose-5-phosphate 4-epimerase/fuculose-1-phosphate aldolase
MSEVEELKDILSTAAQIIRWELADMWGHISCRAPGRDTFFVLPLRPPYDPGLPEDEILEYDLEGSLISGRRDLPAEIFFFTALYKGKENAGAVVHCHPPVAVAMVSAGKKIVPIYQHALRFGKGVPTIPWLYGTFPEDGERAAKAMGKNCAVMMKGHGANVTGRTIQEACLNTIHLERTAKMILKAGSIGKIRPLSPAVLAKFRSVATHRPKRPGPPRSPQWNYYEGMVKRGERWNTW